MRFHIDTFIDHRYEPARRVWHPTGDQNDWITLRNQYNNQRQQGEGMAESVPYITNDTEVLHFRVWPDVFRVLVDFKQLQAGRIELLDTKLGISSAPDADGYPNGTWMELNHGDMVLRSFDAVPADHLETDTVTIRGFIEGRTEEDILGEIAENLGVPKFLLSYREDVLKYEVEVAVPKANTHQYRHLREQHVRA